MSQAKASVLLVENDPSMRELNALIRRSTITATCDAGRESTCPFSSTNTR